MKNNKRALAFVPQLIAHFANHSRFMCKFSALPKSYQAQPYNLAAKITERGGVSVSVIFNKEKDTFTIIKNGNHSHARPLAH